MTFVKVEGGIVTGVAIFANVHTIISTPFFFRKLIKVDEQVQTVPQVGWTYDGHAFHNPS